MKQFFLVIVITILTVFCFAKAQGQAVGLFGKNLPTDTSKTGGQIVATAYVNSDTNKVLGVNASGQLVFRTKGNFSIDTTGLLRTTDTTRSGIVATYYYVDSLKATNTIAKNWTKLDPADSNELISVAYGNGVWVLLAIDSVTADQVMVSSDGINYDTINTPKGAWYDITFGNGLFVATGRGGTNRVMYSKTGRTWDSITAVQLEAMTGEVLPQLQCVTWGGGMFIALPRFDDYVLKSYDGINWTAHVGTYGTWRNIDYGNGKFVAVSGEINAAQPIMRSTDGENWTSISVPDLGAWYSAAYGNGLWVAICETCPTNRIMTSPDAITWTPQTQFNTHRWVDIIYAEGYFVAVDWLSPDSFDVMRSPTGLEGSWELCRMTGDNVNNWFRLAYGNGTFIAVSNKGKIAISGKQFLSVQQEEYLYPADTLELLATHYGVRDTTARFWNTITPPENNNWQNVIYAQGRFVAVSDNGTNRSMYSQDAINWKLSGSLPLSTWNSITYGDGKFVAVARTGTNTTKVAYSYDGVTWTLSNMNTASDLRDVTYGGGLFVIVTNGTAVFYSTDGINWTSTTCPSGTWRRVRYGNGLYCAVSNVTNFIMTSPDAITWTTRTLPTTTGVGWQGLTYGNGKWVATCTNCVPYKLATSIDGITWVGDSSNNTRRWYPITYGGGYYVTVGDSGGDSTRIMISPDATYGSWELLRGEGDSFNNANMVTYGNGVYVIVTNFNRIVTSGRITNLEINQPNDTGIMRNYNAITPSSITIAGTATAISATGGLNLANVEHRVGSNTIYFNDAGSGPRVFGGTGDINWTIVGLDRRRDCTGFSVSDHATDFATTVPSAIMYFKTTTKGFQPPMMTGAQAEAISSPAEGIMVYATDGTGVTITSKGWWGYDGATWVKLN